MQEADCPLWLVGYAELKGKGLFTKYRDVLQESYKNACEWEKVFVYQHFSMNRFLFDLNEFSKSFPQPLSQENLETRLDELGKFRKNQIFGE